MCIPLDMYANHNLNSKDRNVEVPFPSDREASIAYEVLRVDKEPPRSEVSKVLNLKNNILSISFSAPTAHQLRTGVNGFFENLKLFKMGEHTPAPTPSRGVYGFALYLTCMCSFTLYLIWAAVPDHILQSLGITYYPQKYWAIAIPIYCMMGLAVFAFFIYPALNLRLTPPLDSMSTVTDAYAVYRDVKSEDSFINRCGAGEESNVHGIPSVSDIHISDVCKTLYFSKT